MTNGPPIIISCELGRLIVYCLFKIIEIPQQQNIRPPLPPKGEIPLPVPPPRRNKRGIFPSSGSKDQVRTCVIS